MFLSPQENECTTLAAKTFITLKFSWYAERSSLADISLMSCHLIVFEGIRVKIALNVVKASELVQNEAYNIEIKIRLGDISKIFCFCSHAKLPQTKENKFLKKLLLNFTN